MYEQIQQNALAAKVAAASQYDMNDRLRGQMVGGAHVLKDKPLLDAEFDRLSQSVSELNASVSELLDRISPVCQPGMLAESKDAQGCQTSPEATPSEMRGRLMSLRARVDDISRMIAPVKFRIEL